MGFPPLVIFGDSQVIIKWINGENMIHNILLVPLLDEVHKFIEQLDQVDIKHKYREINDLADTLANDGTQMWEGTCFIVKNKNSIIT